MADIIPAVLASDFAELHARLASLHGLSRVVHIDISDGLFTPNCTWPQHPEDRARFSLIASGDERLPFSDSFKFEVHLMMKEPERVADAWSGAGASRIIVHAEALSGVGALAAFQGVERGIAINLGTPLDALSQLAGAADCLQCMGIRQVGFQGEEFDESVIGRVRELKQRYPDKPVSVDGGVNRDTAALLVDAGADRLVVGSAIVGSDDIAGALHYFQNI